MTTRRNRMVALALGILLASATAVLQNSAQADETVTLNEGNFRKLGWSGSTGGGPYQGFDSLGEDDPRNGDGSGPSTALAAGPATPPAGVGSYYLTLHDDDDRVTLSTGRHDGHLLSELSDLGYSTFLHSANRTQAINLLIDLTDDSDDLGLGTGTIRFDQTISRSSNPTRVGLWQTWDAIGASGTRGWSGTENCTGDSFATSCTFAQIVADLDPSTEVAGLALQADAGQSGLNSSLDAISVQTTVAVDETTNEVERTLYDWETQFVAPPTTAPPANRLVTRIDADSVTFDEFNDGRYRGLVEYDADVRTGATQVNWQPLAGVYIEVFLDANGDSGDGGAYESLQCGGFTDLNGVIECSPRGRDLPRMSSGSNAYQVFFAGNATHGSSSGFDMANFEGLDLDQRIEDSIPAPPAPPEPPEAPEPPAPELPEPPAPPEG